VSLEQRNAARPRCLWVALLLVIPLAVRAQNPGAGVRARFGDPRMPTLVVAHRGCHNPAPRHGLPESLPENSLAGLERCILIRADVMETDVRRTKDGYLVLMHDETVDRMTNGSGRVQDLTLTQFKSLRLRQNEGGADAHLTEEGAPTLEQILLQARVRLILNLDVQGPIYADVIAAVKRAGQTDGVIVKEPAAVGSPPLAATPPFDTIPFMPILASAGDGSDLPLVATAQTTGAHPIAFELPRMSSTFLPRLAAVARKSGVRLWTNSLWEGFIAEYGGDELALRDPDAVWGRMIRSGISAIQTDEPEALLAFIKRS